MASGCRLLAAAAQHSAAQCSTGQHSTAEAQLSSKASAPTEILLGGALGGGSHVRRSEWVPHASESPRPKGLARPAVLADLLPVLVSAV